MTKKQHAFNITVLWIVILSIVAVLAFAYSINKSFTPTSGSKIKIYNAPENAVFYIDNKIQKPTLINSQFTILGNVPSGQHILIVNQENHLPWAKNILLTDGIDIEVSTFNMPQEPEIQIIPKNLLNNSNSVSNEVYLKIIKLFSNVTASTTSYNNNVSLSHTDSDITATWLGSREFIPYYFCINNTCDVSFSVINTKTKIQNAAFYPERNNLIIFSSGNAVGIIELDRSGTQNFQPLFTGDKPIFILDPENPHSIYIKDRDTLMRIAI